MGKINAITDHEIAIIRNLYVDTEISVKEMEELTGMRAQRIYRIAAMVGISRHRGKVPGNSNVEVTRPALPIDLLRTWRCPGKNGPCGCALSLDPVFSEKRHSTEHWDLVCTVHHRFTIQEEDWMIFLRKDKNV